MSSTQIQQHTNPPLNYMPTLEGGTSRKAAEWPPPPPATPTPDSAKKPPRGFLGAPSSFWWFWLGWICGAFVMTFSILFVNHLYK
jgi:hypothetical protein